MRRKIGVILIDESMYRFGWGGYGKQVTMKQENVFTPPLLFKPEFLRKNEKISSIHGFRGVFFLTSKGRLFCCGTNESGV